MPRQARCGNLAERLTAIQIEKPSKTCGPRKKEADIKKDCLKWINSLPNTKCIARKGGPGKRGQPDITGCSHGYRIEIEIKVPGKKPTDIQDYWIRMWTAVGAIAGWADSLEKFKALVVSALAKRNIIVDVNFLSKILTAGE